MVHAHVVAAVGVPAERDLREVARADDQGAFHVRKVHQDLRPFPGLCVLVRDVVDALDVSDVGEVFAARLADVDDSHGRADGLRERDGPVLRGPRRAEPRHDDGEEVVALKPQPVERRRSAQKRERGVRAARHAEDEPSDGGARHPTRESNSLDVEQLPPPAVFTVFVKEGRA